MTRYFAYSTVLIAYILGGGALILFAVFCYAGPVHLVGLGLDDRKTLFFDAFLSLAFFIQHSGMVRKSFRRYLSRFIPEAYVSAIYTISSGIVLTVVVLFWQETEGTIGAARGAFRLLLRVMFAASIGGFYWGTSALGSLDPFGVRSVLNRFRDRKPKEMNLTIRGPYSFVRHPLYFFVLIMIWSNPDLTLDRALFNCVWTLWICFGASLEEKDLAADFGKAYEDYKRKVPMLIPWRIGYFRRD